MRGLRRASTAPCGWRVVIPHYVRVEEGGHTAMNRNALRYSMAGAALALATTAIVGCDDEGTAVVSTSYSAAGASALTCGDEVIPAPDPSTILQRG